MSKSWPRVKLGDVLTHRKVFITIDDSQAYTRPRVQIHAQGIVKRDQVIGAEIKTKKQQICHAGDFLVAEIDAKIGGFGLVPQDLEGAIVSSHYFLFRAKPELLDERYLGYFCITPAFREQVEAQGSTNYAAIRPSHVLGYEMPLPPIDEQRRIVARIEEIASQIAKVERLRVSIALEQKALCRSLIANDSSTKYLAVADVVRQRALDVIVQPDQSYQFAGVYSFGKGVFKGQIKSGVEFAYPKLSRVKAGDFIYPKLMAWEGALGVVPPECDDCVVSPEFPVFEIDENKVLPDVFDVHFCNPRTWESLQSGSTGTNARRRRLNPADFLKLHVPVPCQETQRKLRDVRRLQSLLTAAQPDATADALLASVLNQLLAQTRNTQ